MYLVSSSVVRVAQKCSDYVIAMTEKRSEDILCSIEKILIGLPYTTPRKLASVAEKIVSASYVLENISSLMTRSLHYLIATNIFDGNWDGRLNLAHENYAFEGIVFLEKKPQKTKFKVIVTL